MGLSPFKMVKIGRTQLFKQVLQHSTVCNTTHVLWSFCTVMWFLH